MSRAYLHLRNRRISWWSEACVTTSHALPVIYYSIFNCSGASVQVRGGVAPLEYAPLRAWFTLASARYTSQPSPNQWQLGEAVGIRWGSPHGSPGACREPIESLSRACREPAESLPRARTLQP